MTTEIKPTTSSSSSSVPPPPRWASWVAHLVPLCALPSGLWRIAMAVGIHVGYSAELTRSKFHAPGWGSVYMICLSLLVESLALLTLGLVRPWGEVAPRWIPIMGGKPIRPMAAVIAAGTGAVALTVIGVSQLMLWGQVGEADSNNLSGTALRFMGMCYAPLLGWGPLLGVVTVSYYLRHRRR